MKKLLLLPTLLVLILFPTGSDAQYPFGKNKVIYSNKDWKVLQTPHVDIYHYPSERNLVLSVAPAVERTYEEYSELFGLEFEERVPVVLFSSHYDFQQTNIIPQLISEYTGGFTDLMKGRIAIPFTGAYSDLLHVLRHEMVHAFMLEKIRLVMAEHNKFSLNHPPLWFIEGVAEYIASPEANAQSHMYIRDALMHGKLLSLRNIWRIEGTFMMYKHGEAVVRYIATNFGKEAVIQVFENWWMANKFSIVLKKTINMDIDELDDAFMRSVKRRHYPAILEASFVPDIGRQLTEPQTFHFRPAVGPAKEESHPVYALCASDGVIDICSISRDKDGKLKHKSVIKGGRSSSIESIPAFRSKIEIAGDTLVFAAKSRGRDALFLWDLDRNTKILSLSFDHLSMISSPTISPERERVVFNAIDTTGMKDLYLCHLPDGSLERLTSDFYVEEDPDFNPLREVVLFASDRFASQGSNLRRIYALDLASGAIRPLTSGEQKDIEPEWAPDGKSFLFTSDRDGTSNIYLYRDGVVSKQTNVLGGLSAPSFSPGGDRYVAGAYYNGEFHLFELPLKEGFARPETVVASADSTTASWELANDFPFTTKDYKLKLGLDFVGTGIALDPEFGELGNGGQLVLTDMLGNHQFYIFFGNTSEGLDEFWKRLNGGISYVNLSHRLNYSIGVFHLTSFFGDFFTLFRSERRYGVALGASYPFSKFSRVDGSLVLRRVERESDFGTFEFGTKRSTLATTFFTYATDNTLWTIGGPLTGTRYYATVGHTIDFEGKGFASTTFLWDVRKYFKITRRIVLAERFVNRNSWGSDLQLFYLGGPWDFRGYDFRRFVGRSTYLFNSELRFPLVDRLSLRLPFGLIETPMIRGSIFFDVGKVSRYVLDTDWLGSFGAGVELNLGFAPVIRLNFTRTTDFSTISKDTDVEFFIGLNY
ncbi:MAG: hypothetical protein GTO51_05980 [Candidatus Latescibacteria bacterium]|nr:hypothetical protein [Candidatus Latescibacterota bacterium]NIM21340.1 hypothetical protein [Candidatus Latescibacterota bacterium]NIM65521.1 hypothetical protein [Candidatus Latescibacterota bacterium]NIO01901.1 hypothetical protein [Candidatus Latescibacterota bacterium]NIO28714.1 hypothetical protein [Candidatus Latescibacterota bacterium]